MKIRKSLLSLGLAVSLALGCAAPSLAAGDYANFKRTAEYTDGLFSDVAPDAWYRDSVAAVYDLGLMNGTGEGDFNTEGNVRLSEAVAMAARLHSIYRTGAAAFAAPAEGEAWYRPYAAYALSNGLLDADAEDYDAYATRRQFAAVLGRAMPASALPEVNEVEDDLIPDVKVGEPGAEEIYRLYRAGVLTGGNSRGSFRPETPIVRTESAVILARMAYRSLRQKFTLEPMGYPDLDAQPVPLGNDDFAGSAMLGNSLVDGMQLFSGLKMDFYGSTGANVFNNSVGTLLNKTYDRIYIEFGINEISYATENVIKTYSGIIDRIREKMPEAEIYVMAVTPVTKLRSDAGAFTMKRITEFNNALRNMCVEKKCWYLDCCTTLTDADGYLPTAYAGWDGSPHLSSAGYQAWADVIKTYYA